VKQQMYFYQTKLPSDKKSLSEIYTKFDPTLDYIYYGRRKKSGLYQGILPKLDTLSFIYDNVPHIKFCSIIKVLKGEDLKPHTDTRGCALNYPIIIPEGSMNTFFDGEKDSKTVNQAYLGKQKTSSAKLMLRGIECGKFFLDRPTLINTHEFHGVTESCDQDRVVLSVTFEKDFDDFDLIQRELENAGW
jgi:hypothetical protein